MASVISITWDSRNGWHADSAQLPELCLSARTLDGLLTNLRDCVGYMVDGQIDAALRKRSALFVPE